MTANSYSFGLTSSTNSDGRLSLPALLLTGILLASVPIDEGRAAQNEFYTSHFSGTFGEYQNMFSGSYPRRDVFEFEETLTNFYGKLLATQEHLDNDFARILYNNLWELYDE